jgi:hypothetical protein
MHERVEVFGDPEHALDGQAVRAREPRPRCRLPGFNARSRGECREARQLRTKVMMSLVTGIAGRGHDVTVRTADVGQATAGDGRGETLGRAFATASTGSAAHLGGSPATIASETGAEPKEETWIWTT